MKYTVLGLLLAVLACTPTPSDRPTGLALSETGTPTSLTVFAKWNASTVPSPTGPITYEVVWVKNGASLRSVPSTAALADTVSFARAPIGGADTIDFSVRAHYLTRVSTFATTRRIYPNVDQQLPTVPTITAVDTL